MTQHYPRQMEIVTVSSSYLPHFMGLWLYSVTRSLIKNTLVFWEVCNGYWHRHHRDNLFGYISSIPRWLSGKESICQTGDTRDLGGSGKGRSPGGGNGNSFQSCWRIPAGYSQTCKELDTTKGLNHHQGWAESELCNQLGHSAGEGNGTHSSTLAWKIPWMEEPGRLQSMGSLRVRHNWATSLSLFTFMHRRRKWQPTPVFLPGESQGRGSLVGCRLWGLTESDTTDGT